MFPGIAAPPGLRPLNFTGRQPRQSKPTGLHSPCHCSVSDARTGSDNNDPPGLLRVDTDGRTVVEIALDVLASVGWDMVGGA
jgi:hypothetical protein